MQNNCKNLLKPTLPLRIPQRAVQINKMAESLNPNFKPVLSLETPLEDYKKLIKQNVEVEGIMDDDLRDENFTKISNAAREAAWKLIFVEQPTPENQEKAANILKQHKMDACFHSPWDYNEWVVTLRDELLKQGKLDFWRNEMVKKELGPCWARDSDFFDDIESEQPEIEAYYAHGGCVAPFSHSSETSENNAQNVETDDFDAVISLENPMADYTKLMEEHVLMDYIISDEVLAESFSKISAAARETVWKLLFSEQPPTQQNLTKAAELLRKHKSDACFHFPWDYNDWIVKVRDELLRRKMFDFWREQIVKHELGPCWVRDSDYFDDPEDTAPEAFYKYAGCVAPFSSEAQNQIAPAAAGSASSSAAVPANVPMPAETAPLSAPAKISHVTPAEDYKAKMDYQVNLDPDDIKKFNDIFKEAQQVIWDLLFKESALTSANFEKAAGLLKAYKQDACFYNPHIYNEWILKLRDELFVRKSMDFWKRAIVDQECGLCWYKDSDYFDDTEDMRPIEFYKSGDALMKQ